jgi:hypothetical protein
MTARGFPLPNSQWYFSIRCIDKVWTIEITEGVNEIVNVKASNKRLAVERAWDKLDDYCFRHTCPACGKRMYHDPCYCGKQISPKAKVSE